MSNQQVKYTITGENLLSKVLKQVDVDAQKAENSVNSVSKSGKGGGMLGSIIGGNLISNGISKISGSLVSFGKDVVDSLVNYQYFSTSLKTMMKGDADMSKALETQLVSLAKTTPFSLVDVQQGTKQLMAYGFAGGEVVGTMRMLGDVSAGVGKPLTEVAYLYGTLKTQGRAFSKDINQFTSAGIPIVKELAKQFKVTEASVMGLVEKGKVGFPEVEKAFQSMTKEGGLFFNLMDEQSKTVGGQLSAMGDTWDQLKVNIGKSQSGIIAGTTNFINDYLAQLNKGLAAQNFVDDATKKEGNKGSMFKMLTGSGAANISGIKNEQLAAKMQDVLEKKTGTSTDISSTAKFISAEMARITSERNIGKEGQEGIIKSTSKEYSDQMAILVKASKELMGASRLLHSKEEVIGGKDLTKKDAKDKLGTGVTIESQAPKNQYITINGGLVHEMKIESVNGSFPVEKMKELTETALVELLNDAYQAMR